MHPTIQEYIDLRDEKNISQHKIAEMTGLRQEHISRIEKGRNSPMIKTVEKLANAVGKTVVLTDINK